jgi:hypothetical protein
MGQIANLDRNFDKAFFISNQFIRDKARAEMESELSKKHGFEVHILDRTWIVKTVIEHKREDIAVDTLNIRLTGTQKPQLGPRDTSRQQELDVLIKQLSRPEVYYANDYALAQGYLKAGKLARGLGKPRHEVDGFFIRARDLAGKNNLRGQIIRCGYDHAWTSYWWFDDPLELQKIYSEIEDYLPGTHDAEECELFSNLWHLLYTSVRSGEITEENGRLDERLSVIKAELARLADQRDRPNNALYAETVSLLLELPPCREDSSQAKKVFEKLKACLRRSDGLGIYPTMRFIDNLTEMGEFFGELLGYDSLFGEMRQIARLRVGESHEGKLLYERGVQLLDKNRPKDVLRYLGEARIKLAKEETLRESNWAALGCSDAYMTMNLHWAARMEALIVVHHALRPMHTTGHFFVEGLLASKRLGWAELALGRIAPFISWYELSWILLGQLSSKQYDIESIEKDLRLQDSILGCYFLNLPSEYVEELAQLQHSLDQLNLPMARWALLYALNEIDALVEEMPEDMAKNPEKLDEFFLMWKRQPASKQVPKEVTGETRTYCNYETSVMGIRFRLTTRNSFGPIAFSENLLGIIEAALASARWENLAFVVDAVHILVDVDESGQNPPPLALDVPPEPGGYRFIWRPDMLEWLNITERERVCNYLMQLLLKLMFDITIDPMEDLVKELDYWGKEHTFSRSLGTSPTSIALEDLLGKDRYELAHWCNPAASP